MKNTILKTLVIIITVLLCVPSLMYLINNNTVDQFDSYYTYSLNGYGGENRGTIEGIVVIGLLLLYSIIYLVLLKKNKECFKSVKNVIIFIAIISLLFMLILPFLSSDIYYYIGDAWLNSKYNQNPYYTTVQDLQDNGINDEILNNTGVWRNTTSVYGPLWNSLAKVFVSFSFGNVTLALFIFKIMALLVHLFNCYLIYKITKDLKYTLLYGLNPLVLIEFLSNVHNDIYLVLFILLALYFLLKLNSKIFVILFLALSIAIKYSTVLIVPFILIYMYKDKSIPKRFAYCIISGLSIIGIVGLLYLPYYRDYTIFTNMLVQGTKYSQSILLFLMNYNNNGQAFVLISNLIIPIFLLVYCVSLIKLLFTKDIEFEKLISKYNCFMLVFIFVVISNFQKWYILWLLPTIFWQNKYMQKFITYLTIFAIVPSFRYFVTGGDGWKEGITYSIQVLALSAVILGGTMLINKYMKIKKERTLLLNK